MAALGKVGAPGRAVRRGGWVRGGRAGAPGRAGVYKSKALDVDCQFHP